jgi:uncharacterized protein (TIGR02118 family)
MIKVSVFYPNKKGSSFDMAYYCDRHIPLVQRLLRPALKGAAVEQGLGGVTPGSAATYVAMGHLLFDSADAFQKAFGAHADEIMGDIPNYTNIEPIIQISEVKL